MMKLVCECVECKYECVLRGEKATDRQDEREGALVEYTRQSYCL